MLGFESECAFIGYPSQTKPRGLILYWIYLVNLYLISTIPTIVCFRVTFAYFFAKVIVIFQRVAEPSSESYKKKHPISFEIGCKSTAFF